MTATDESGAIRCPHCDGERWDRTPCRRIAYGRCSSESCRHQFLLPDREIFRLATPVSKITQFLQLINEGFSLRASVEIVGIHRNTGRSILVATGTDLRCSNDLLLCNATANVMQSMKAFGCSPHVELAFKFASEVSELNAADYLGACYEGVQEACSRGICDENALRLHARKAVRRHWDDTLTFRTKSLDAMREAKGFEPARDCRIY